VITPAYAITATERVLPRMALDFTTASLDSRVTFTRTGNTATVTNSSGYVVPINADLPRFDFDPITLACKGLLIEESRTNLYLRSDDFADAGWVKIRATVTSNATTAPDNTLTGDKFIPSIDNSNHFLRQDIPVTSGTSYTQTIYAKAAEYSQIYVGFNTDSSTFAGGGAFFTLTGNGTVASDGGTLVSFSITNVGNGWYRCQVSATATATATAVFRIQAANGSTTSFAGNASSGIFVWGAQLEAGAFPTSYIPTVASQVTRTADVATMTGTNFSDWYNASEGTFKVLYQRPIAILNSFEFQVSDGSFNNILACYTDAANQIGIVNSGGSAVAAFNYAAGAGTNNAVNTKTLAYKLNSFAASINGGTTLTDVSGAVPVAPIRLNIGVFLTTQYLNGYIKQIAYWPQRLINNEVRAFSK